MKSRSVAQSLSAGSITFQVQLTSSEHRNNEWSPSMTSRISTATGAVSLFWRMCLRDRVDAETYRRGLRGVLLIMVLVLSVQYLAGLWRLLRKSATWPMVEG